MFETVVHLVGGEKVCSLHHGEMRAIQAAKAMMVTGTRGDKGEKVFYPPHRIDRIVVRKFDEQRQEEASASSKPKGRTRKASSTKASSK